MGITSISLAVVVVPALRQPESLSTVGTTGQLDMPSLPTWPWSPDRWSCTPVLESPNRLRHCQANLGQHHQSWTLAQTQSVRRAGTFRQSWVQAPRIVMASGLLPNASTAHLEADFTPEAWGTRPPVEPVKVLQLNPVAQLLLELTSRPTATQTGVKVMHPPALIKLQPQWVGKPGDVLDEVPSYG